MGEGEGEDYELWVRVRVRGVGLGLGIGIGIRVWARVIGLNAWVTRRTVLSFKAPRMHCCQMCSATWASTALMTSSNRYTSASE
jgi:hypothetical protein